MAKMVLLAEVGKMPISGNNQHGFSLLELLIVLFIAGILLSFSVFSVNLLNKHNQNSVITQLQNQVQSAQHRAKMFNFLMRIRLYEDEADEDRQRIVTERFNFNFDIDKQKWVTESEIPLTDEVVTMTSPFIVINPNGFITDGEICINEQCWQSASK